MKVIDNFLKKEFHKELFKYCNKVEYKKGEQDNIYTPPTGAVFEIEKTNPLRDYLGFKMKKNIDFLEGMECTRSYINIFSKEENPFFHIDSKNGYTCIYYPNIEEENINEGGETQFHINGNIRGILPKPNRLVVFKGDILHKATSFRTKNRYTIVFKYEFIKPTSL
jgi:hypothetical protein